MDWRFVFGYEVRIAGARAGNKDFGGLVPGEGEVGYVGRLCVESARRQDTRTRLIGLASIPKVPFTGNDKREPIVAVRVRSDSSMCRYLKLNGIRARLGRVPCEQKCLDPSDS